ncbi:hypothetical protein OS493_032901 [Desmophyllum pertusum]|uniref:Uncharacterized protein n=1 Tax=Desmophyllum pertusum TaxID=174260 RepID=A0A9W9YJ92_9CNID|nr:hypothetical protein OS493_032901 [Desmophyllum pertusum]
MMGLYQFLGLFSFTMIALGGLSTATNQSSSFQVLCDFGDSHYSTDTTVIVNGSLTSHFNNARTCHVKHKSESAVVRVTVAAFNSTSNISALYSVVLEKLNILFVGVAHSLDLQNMHKYHFHACPLSSPSIEPDSSKTTDLDLLFFGAPANESFAVMVELDNSVLTLDEIANVSVRSDGLAEVKAFDIEEDQLFSLLQITVSSDDSEMECLLVVSQSCSAAQSQGLAEKNSGERNQTIQLTFTKSGRITLSQYSRPNIMSGRWYIGLHSKRIDREKSLFQKTVKVTVTQGYRYDTVGKTLPAGYMCLAAILGGIAISVFAHFFLNSDFDKCSVPFYLEQKSAEERARSPSRGIVDYIPEPIPRKTFPIRRWTEVICVAMVWQRCKDIFLLDRSPCHQFHGWFQPSFVIARWSNMIEGGDRDLCYYNELCYRPIAVADMPSNFMLSNVPYVIHGIFLALSFSFRKQSLWRQTNRKTGTTCTKHVLNSSRRMTTQWHMPLPGR